MFFPQDVMLEDEKVLLRPLQMDDIEFLLPYALNEPDLWKYSATSPAGKEGMEKYIRSTVDQRAARNEYPFIIFDKSENQYAGSSRFYNIQLHNLSAEIGYTWYGKKFQRTGLNRHCKLLLLGYAFETWGIERVGFAADNRNNPSINAMKAIGCVPEGLLRSYSPSVLGGRRDAIVLSILKQEWLDGGKEKLKALIR